MVVRVCHAHSYRFHHDLFYLHRLCLLEFGSIRSVNSFVFSRGDQAIITHALEVKCVTPAAYARQSAVLKSITILDIFSDAFRKSWRSRLVMLVSITLTSGSVISIPVLLLWNVQISVRRKLALGGILCLSVCTMIISIVKVAGGINNNGGVDASWVLFWYETEAAVAIIVVSVTAFRALFVAHQAMKYRSPAEDASTSWRSLSKKSKSSRGKELPEIPSPVLGGVRTHIRGSHYGGLSFDRGGDDMEMPLQSQGITVTQVLHSEKVRKASSFREEGMKADVKSRRLARATRGLQRNHSYEPQT